MEHIMDEIRSQVWDHVFRSQAQTVDQIAEQLGLSREVVVEVVNHEWFQTDGDRVAIATKGESTAP